MRTDFVLKVTVYGSEEKVRFMLRTTELELVTQQSVLASFAIFSFHFLLAYL